MHFPEVKEALYSRCTILVEGETEYGSFPYFAKTLGINFDYYGICLINARGESSITKISQLIRRFHIPTVCLYDKDVMVENPKPYVFYTDYICYEMDVVQACISSGSIGVLNRVIHSVEDSSDVVNSSLVKKRDKNLAWLVVLIRRESCLIFRNGIIVHCSSTTLPGFMEIKGSLLEELLVNF